MTAHPSAASTEHPAHPAGRTAAAQAGAEAGRLARRARPAPGPGGPARPGAGRAAWPRRMAREMPGLAARLVAAGEQVVGEAREPVSMPLIRQWCAAIGDKNPVYTDAAAAAGSVHGGLVAPPAMIQVWTMPGLARKPAEAADELLGVLKAAGYTGVVATNCEQSYDRYLRPGELLRTTTRMGEFSGPKQTGLGEGYFVTWHTTWYSGDERVGQMMFRVLQFKPPSAAGRRGDRIPASRGGRSSLRPASAVAGGPGPGGLGLSRGDPGRPRRQAPGSGSPRLRLLRPGLLRLLIGPFFRAPAPGSERIRCARR